MATLRGLIWLRATCGHKEVIQSVETQRRVGGFFQSAKDVPMGRILDKAAAVTGEGSGRPKQGVSSGESPDPPWETGAAQMHSADGKAGSTDADRETKIRERAYYLWIRQGLPEGRQQEHWHEAEKEVDAEQDRHKM